MAKERVHVSYDFTSPVEAVFHHLSEHENLGPIFGAKIQRVCDGNDGARNGAGSCRRMKLGPLPWFEETTTKVIPNKIIEYMITKGNPLLKGHHGAMVFTERPGGGTHLDYTIKFDTVVPGLAGPVAAGLKRSIIKGFGDVDGAIAKGA